MSELKGAWMALESHWKITPKDARITGDASYGFMRWTLAPLFRMLLRVKIRGIGNVPNSGPTILAANHLSHVDPLVVILASREDTLSGQGWAFQKLRTALIHEGNRAN